MSVRFEVNYEDIIRLEENLKRIPEHSERIINDILRDYGVELAKDEITEKIKISSAKKKHAKNSNPLTQEVGNLYFVVKTKKKYNYLVFPNNALGTSVNNNPQKFMEKGIDDSTQRIIDQINERIVSKIQEVLE